MSVNIKDSTKTNNLKMVAGKPSENVYEYSDALTLEEISASTSALLGNKIPTAKAVKDLSGGIQLGLVDGKPAWKVVGADTFVPFSNLKYSSSACLFKGGNYTGRTGSYSTSLTSGYHIIIAITAIGRDSFSSSYNNFTFTSQNNNHTIEILNPFTFNAGWGSGQPCGSSYIVYKLYIPTSQTITCNWTGGDGNYASGLVSQIIFL